MSQKVSVCQLTQTVIIPGSQADSLPEWFTEYFSSPSRWESLTPTQLRILLCVFRSRQLLNRSRDDNLNISWTGRRLLTLNHLKTMITRHALDNINTAELMDGHRCPICEDPLEVRSDKGLYRCEKSHTWPMCSQTMLPVMTLQCHVCPECDSVAITDSTGLPSWVSLVISRRCVICTTDMEASL